MESVDFESLNILSTQEMKTIQGGVEPITIIFVGAAATAVVGALFGIPIGMMSKA